LKNSKNVEKDAIKPCQTDVNEPIAENMNRRSRDHFIQHCLNSLKYDYWEKI
jgi:hypothetical protein